MILIGLRFNPVGGGARRRRSVRHRRVSRQMTRRLVTMQFILLLAVFSGVSATSILGTSTFCHTNVPTDTRITPSTPSISSSRRVIPICQTEVCKNEADRLKHDMDLSVDPCEDFYQYSCGGYIKNHKLPDDKSRYGVFDESEEKVNQRLSDLLARDSPPEEIQPLQFVRHLFQSCNDSGK